jgi:hypothetical protein
MNKQDRFSKTSGYLLNALVALGLGLFLLLLLFTHFNILSTPSTADIHIFLLLVAGIIIAALLYGVTRPYFDPLESIFLISVIYLFNFPLRALFILYFPNETRYFYHWSSDDRYILEALQVLAIGLIFFYIGYFSRFLDWLANALPRIPFHYTERFFLTKTLILYFLGLIGLYLLFAQGSFLRFQWFPNVFIDALTSFLDFVNHPVRLLALMLLWSRWDAPRPGLFRFLAVVFLLLEIAIGVFIGSKQHIFDAFLAVLFAYHYLLRRDLHKLVAFALIIGVFFLFVVFPLVQTYRNVYYDVLGFRPDPTIADMVKVAQGLQDRDDYKNLFDVVANFMNRASYFDSLTMIVRYVPVVIPYQNGLTFQSLLFGWIPRAIWPGKPEINLGGYMMRAILGSRSVTNAGLTSLGDFYLNFGLVGIVLGMFALGTFRRAVYVYAKRSNENMFYSTIWIFLLFVTLVFGFESGVASAVVAILRNSLFAVLIIFFMSFTPLPSQQPK